MTNRKKIAVIGCGTCIMLGLGLAVAAFFVIKSIDEAVSECLSEDALAEGIIDSFAEFNKEKQPWIECEVSHPGNDASITFLQRTIHPFLAEYEYKVRFGVGQDAVERWLPLNCGGRTVMNVYWYPVSNGSGACIRLQNHWGEYLLDLAKKKTYRILRYKGRVFAGEIGDGGSDYSMGTSTSAGRKSEIRVFVGKNSAADITHTLMGSRQGDYFGRIDGRDAPLRFVKKSEAPEVQIKMD